MRQLWIALFLLAFPAAVSAEEMNRDAKLKAAVERGLTVVARGAKNYPNHRKCFSCHHQTLPMMAMAYARDAGHKVDSQLFADQLRFSQSFFEKRKESLSSGGRIGGAAATVAYGLWTYEIADAPADDISDAMVANLLSLQHADGHWEPPSFRPPLEESHVSCTVLAAYTLQVYGRGDQKEASQKAFEKAGKWLADAKLTSTEDRAFAFLWHARFQPHEERAATVGKQLLQWQREDGGWGQTAEMESDAYATSQAVFALTLQPDTVGSKQYRKGVDYLLSTQLADGSWHVKTRSKPVQAFFDNGDPHGTDQFISMAATSWATTALIAASMPDG